ncbi:S-adenosyl-L-methionine-dependent methyltransferase [Parasitella parasitica]|nr:S-adenosyl-L-methionine-dependent methyltransferase [Parasitella parasitica]
MTDSFDCEYHSNFLKIFQDADHRIQDESFESPFPVYLDGIDTTLGPFCPTSAKRVLKALRMAKVGPGDVVVDLGSGDGRFVTAAVAEFKATRAVGIESDSDLIETSKRLANQVIPNDSSATTFILGDLLDLPKLVHDMDWTVMIVFLLPDHTDKFADMLLHHYRKGARIISLVFNLNEIPELNMVVSDAIDGIYVYSSNCI